MTTEEGDFLAAVREDLNYLTEHWKEVSEINQVRMTGAILSRLITEGHLGRAARILDMPAKVYALKTPPIPATGFWQNGGATYRGMQIAQVRMSHGPIDDPTPPPMPEPVPMALDEFIKQPVLGRDGTNVTPPVLINYVRNKLGTVHYDPRRNQDDKHYRQFLVLDDAQRDLELLGEGPVWIEFLAIGQAIAKSQYVKRIQRTLNDLAQPS